MDEQEKITVTPSCGWWCYCWKMNQTPPFDGSQICSLFLFFCFLNQLLHSIKCRVCLRLQCSLIPPLRLHVQKKSLQWKENMWKHYMSIKEGMGGKGGGGYHTKVWLSWKGYWIYHVKSISGVSWVRLAVWWLWTKKHQKLRTKWPQTELVCCSCSGRSRLYVWNHKHTLKKSHLHCIH